MIPDVINELNLRWGQQYAGLGWINLKFSNWTLWNKRTTLEHLDKLGVYILAKYPNGPPANVDPIGDNVVYIGETKPGKTTSLRNRLAAFDGAAFGNGAPHSGGYTYKQSFGNANNNDLYVSVCPLHWDQQKMNQKANLSKGDGILLEEAIIHNRVLLLEVCLRGVYVLRWGRLPKCNKK